MSSFFNRFKGNTNPSSPTANSAPATKKDSNAHQPTPLEKLVVDAGPLRHDGSDKFFGFENQGSTCYANSIIQCLYYTADFRDEVIKFPSSSPLELSNERYTTLSPVDTSNGHNENLLGRRPRRTLPTPKPTSPRKPPPPPGTPGTLGYKPEDSKDAADYRKRLALAAGPVLEMNYENSSSYGMTESLFTALKDIFEAVIGNRSRIGVVSPHRFLDILRKENEVFRPTMHQDAHEFLNLLLNQVVEGVENHSKEAGSPLWPIENTNQKDESTVALTSGAVLGTSDDVKHSSDNPRWVHDLFEGTLTSETRCLTCENISQRDEAFLDLSVDIEQHSSVTSCLKKFSEEEMLCERNKFHCDNCGGLQEAEKRMKIKKSPRILALHLKRFKYTENMQKLQKLFHRVVYPYHLRLFNTTDDAEEPDRMYELYAVVVHIGSGPFHGHYVSIVKTKESGWLLFDDELVEPVDKSYVQNFFGDGHKLACAYVLFYRETTFEAVEREQDAENAPPATPDVVPAPNGTLPEEKTNGTVANGWHHPLVPAPSVDEAEHFLSLEHVATAPLERSHSPRRPMLQTAFTTPTLSDAGVNSPEAQSRSERKSAETDKQAKRRSGVTGNGSFSTKETRESQSTDGNFMGGSLNRFKQTGASLGQRSRFWGSKEKTTAPRDTAPRDAAAPKMLRTDAPVHGNPANVSSPIADPIKPARSKSKRFSLGWKRA